MPLPRFRLRTLMAVVLCAGVFLGAAVEIGRLSRLAAEYRRRAARFDEMERIMRRELAREEEFLAYTRRELDSTTELHRRIALMRLPGVENTVAHRVTFVGYAKALKDKYERASHRPWAAIAPDPPEPSLKRVAD